MCIPRVLNVCVYVCVLHNPTPTLTVMYVCVLHNPTPTLTVMCVCVCASQSNTHTHSNLLVVLISVGPILISNSQFFSPSCRRLRVCKGRQCSGGKRQQIFFVIIITTIIIIHIPYLRVIQPVLKIVPVSMTKHFLFAVLPKTLTLRQK